MKLESKIGRFYVITPEGERIGPPKTPEEIQLLTQIYFPEPGTKVEESETGVTFTWEEFEAEFLISGIILNPKIDEPEPSIKKLLDFFSLAGLSIVLPFSFFSWIIEDTVTAFAILFFGTSSVFALQICRRYF
jgi:hypothetical protein